jgi:hypothetical protein
MMLASANPDPSIAAARTRCETPSHVSVVAFVPEIAPPNHAVATTRTLAAVSDATSVVLRHASALTPEADEKNEMNKLEVEEFDVALARIETLSNVSSVRFVPASGPSNREVEADARRTAVIVAFSVVLRHPSALTPVTDEVMRRIPGLASP